MPLASSFYDDDEEEIPGFCRAGSYIMPEKVEKYDDVQDLMDSYGLCTQDDELNEELLLVSMIANGHKRMLLQKTLMKNCLMHGIISPKWLNTKSVTLFFRIRIS